jgi:hypothetical protein
MTIILPPPPEISPEVDVSLELKVLRDQTEWFIAWNSIDLILTPVKRMKTTSGGTAQVNMSPRPLQKLRLISMFYTQKPTITDDGIEREIDLTLLGPWDAQIDVGDWWRDGEGLIYDVVELVPYNGYEVRALVVKRGHG